MTCKLQVLTSPMEMTWDMKYCFWEQNWTSLGALRRGWNPKKIFYTYFEPIYTIFYCLSELPLNTHNKFNGYFLISLSEISHYIHLGTVMMHHLYAEQVHWDGFHFWRTLNRDVSYNYRGKISQTVNNWEMRSVGSRHSLYILGQ